MYAIMKEEKNVSEIVEEVGASQSLVSHQLSVLKNADLVSTRKDGTKVFYRLADEHVDMLLKIVYEHVSEKE
jgi:DNA-binding transcriptional ArsR family regulator